MIIPRFENRETLMQALELARRNIRLDRPSIEAIEALADAIYAWQRCNLFDFLVVGSFVELGPFAEDIDIIVRAKPDTRPGLRAIEDVLVTIEHFGLTELNVPIDTTFRVLSEEEMSARIVDGTPFPSVKLDAPRWRDLAESEPQAVRPIGRYLVEIWRSINQTSYFEKLPFIEKQGGRYRGYRTGVSLLIYHKSGSDTC